MTTFQTKIIHTKIDHTKMNETHEQMVCSTTINNDSPQEYVKNNTIHTT